MLCFEESTAAGELLHWKWLSSLQVEAISRERSDVSERLTHAQVSRKTANPACWEAPQPSRPGMYSWSFVEHRRPIGNTPGHWLTQHLPGPLWCTWQPQRREVFLQVAVKQLQKAVSRLGQENAQLVARQAALDDAQHNLVQEGRSMAHVGCQAGATLQDTGTQPLELTAEGLEVQSAQPSAATAGTMMEACRPGAALAAGAGPGGSAAQQEQSTVEELKRLLRDHAARGDKYKQRCHHLEVTCLVTAPSSR